MFLGVILKDLKEGAEELTMGVGVYVSTLQINVGYEILNRVLSILIPLTTAYIVHKLKKNYWEADRPFFSNIISDLKKRFKK